MLVGDKSRVPDRRAIGQKRAKCIERTALNARGQLLRQTLPRADMHHAEAAKITVFRAKRAVNDIDRLDQFRRKRFQRAQVTLPVALRSLVLLNIVGQHFQAAIDTAVVEIKTETPDLQRFSAAFML